MTMQLFETLINGLLLGGLYGLIGLGLSINFGTMRVVYLAHGDLIVFAAYFLVVGLVPAGIPPLVAAAVVVPALFALGWALQRFLVGRSLGRGILPPLIVTFGISMVVQNLLLLWATADARTLQSSLVDFAIGLASLGALLLVLGRTALGRALRATSDDADTARLMGIDPRKMYAVAAGISAATGGVAGMLLAATRTFYPTTGSEMLVIAFEVVVVGGLGQLVGAHVWGPSYGQVTAHLVVLLLLVFRPQGLLPRTAP